MTTFSDFFRQATSSKEEPNGREPYDFQKRFAEASETYHLVHAPTGSGKTATAVLGWLWRWHTKQDVPRRLIYCLPMRVLVEQSVHEISRWVENLKLDVDVFTLMGGIDVDQWYLQPEKPAILVGTQDMLLSRALNRGYAASRFHWPIDFGLMNNDCMWVFDEPQLMASGVSTSAQLAGMRKILTSFGNCPSMWMSATLEPDWLDTIDFKGRFPGKPLELSEEDYNPEKPLFDRMTAEKTLSQFDVPSSKDTKAIAKELIKKHIPGTQTLIILNTVDRARAVYREIERSCKNSPNLKPLLIHSRFRPIERRLRNQQLQDRGEATKDRIIIATQVVEAGVDISARTLITDLAPWACIVQRIGRCNRTGTDGPGKVLWIDLDDKSALPYERSDLDFSRKQLHLLEDKGVSPRELDDFKKRQTIKLPFEHKHVLRRRDLLDLFDTTPDLSGNDIDIQRFVRGDDPDSDVQVFWREMIGGAPAEDEPLPQRDELCNVPIGDFRNFLEKVLGPKKRGHAFIWDHLDNRWIKLESQQLRPGLTILLPATAGGYSEELGWDKSSSGNVKEYPPKKKIAEEGTDSDRDSSIPVALTIAEHTKHVCEEMDRLIESIAPLADDLASLLNKAARWHDIGKSHEIFQGAMHKTNPQLAEDCLWAKSGTKKPLKYARRHFRHELASALAALQQDMPFLVVYLVAAHHGKARLTLRAMPGETDPPSPEIPFALGIYHGDRLPAVELGNDEACPEMTLDLSPIRLGSERSWVANALKLLDELGPFKLAYLEALLRVADSRASQKEADHA